MHKDRYRCRKRKVILGPAGCAQSARPAGKNLHLPKFPTIWHVSWLSQALKQCALQLASPPGRLPLHFLDWIRDLLTAQRSGRRPDLTRTSSNRKVDSIVMYVDLVSVIMATCPHMFNIGSSCEYYREVHKWQRFLVSSCSFYGTVVDRWRCQVQISLLYCCCT